MKLPQLTRITGRWGPSCAFELEGLIFWIGRGTSTGVEPPRVSTDVHLCQKLGPAAAIAMTTGLAGCCRVT